MNEINHIFKRKIVKTKDFSVFDFPEGSDYRIIVSRTTCLMLRCVFPFILCSRSNYKKRVGYEHCYTAEYPDQLIVFDFNQLAEEAKILEELYKKDKNIFIKLANQCEKESKPLMDFSKKIKKTDFSNLPDEELHILLGKYFDMVVNFDIFLLIPHAAQKYLESALNEYLEGLDINDDKRREYHDIFCTAYKNNFGFFEQKDILEISVEYKNHGLTSEIQERVKEHAFEFGHIGCKYGIGKVWEYDDILERVKFLSKEYPDKKLNDLLVFDAEVEQKLKQALTELKPPVKIKELIDITRTYIYIRTLRTDVLSGSYANIIPMLFEIGRRNKLDNEEIMLCFPDEIIEGRFPSKETIKERECVAIKALDGKLYYMEGKNAKKVVKKILFLLEKKEGNINTDQVEGNIANKGKITAKVKILVDNSDLGKVNEGDIIVAAMTTPDFVPAMERAAGFITNEGGITCHAAIISREMNKPCIIGTRIATKVFKDGDLVELDADKGIARKLK